MHESIQKQIAKYFQDTPVKAVYLFGSRSKGKEGQMSDYDFGILFSKDISKNQRFEKRFEYSSAITKMLNVDEKCVDLVDLQNAPFTLAFAATSGELLYDRGSIERIEFEVKTMAEMHTDFYYIERDYNQSLESIRKGVYFS